MQGLLSTSHNACLHLRRIKCVHVTETRQRKGRRSGESLTGHRSSPLEYYSTVVLFLSFALSFLLFFFSPLFLSTGTAAATTCCTGAASSLAQLALSLPRFPLCSEHSAALSMFTPQFTLFVRRRFSSPFFVRRLAASRSQRLPHRSRQWQCQQQHQL